MKKLLKTDIGGWVERLSRWIEIKHNYNPSLSRNPLADYIVDENGHENGSSMFDPNSNLSLDYFVFDGKKYAMGQFARLGSAWAWPIFYEEDGCKIPLAGYDHETYYDPIYIELDDACEHVRVYHEVLKEED